MYDRIQEAPRHLTFEYVFQDLIGNKKLERRLFASNDVKNDGRDTLGSFKSYDYPTVRHQYGALSGDTQKRGGIRGVHLRKAVCRH